MTSSGEQSCGPDTSGSPHPLLFRRKAVLITDVPFWYPATGKAVRIRDLIGVLASAGLEVHVLYARPLRAGQRESALGCSAASITAAEEEAACGLFHRWGPVAWRRLRRRIPGPLRRLCSGPVQPRSLADCEDGVLAEAARRLTLRLQPDVVLVEYLELTCALRHVSPSIPRLIDTHDVKHLHVTEYEAQGLAHTLRVTRDEERRYLERYDVIIAIQSRDADVFRRLVPGRMVITCGVSAAAWEADPRPRKDVAAEPGPVVLCVGCRSPANVMGLQGFITKAWPAILQARPNARLVVCGTVAKALSPGSGQNLDLRGFVADLSSAYAEADVVISPVQFGGGLKIKSVEALAFGKACVMSEHSAIGLEDGRGWAYETAGTWDEFAARILALLAAPEAIRRLEASAVRYTNERLRPDVAFGPLVDVLAEMLADRRGVIS